jgi:signal transduction histidine kinase/CheY-like chemotaxis protein
MKKRWITFEIKIISGILLAVVIVIAMGILSYRSLTDIVMGIREESRPDLKLSLLKNILSDLSDAESSVKSYSISNDTQYLPSFYQTSSSIDEKMDRLYTLSLEYTFQKPLIDSISALIEEKFSILHQLIFMQKENRVEETINKISKKIKESDNQRQKKADYVQPAPEKNEQVPKFMSKIFGKGTKDEIKAPQPLESKSFKSEPIGLQLKEIEQEIERIKDSEIKKSLAKKKMELELTMRDKIVMDKIRNLLSRLEEQETELIKKKVIDAENKASRAYFLIGTFCIMVFILLLIVCYFIVSFFIKNNAYKVALRNAKTEAENHSKAKAGFLANMSHEIRTPLSAITGFSEQLMASSLRGEDANKLDIIKKSADHLMAIVNDILDFSKLGSGKMELEQVGFQPESILEEVVSIMQQEALNKGLKFYYSTENKVPRILMGDPVRLKQVLLNIVNNAIKFTDSGEVKIYASSMLLDEGKTVQLNIAVADTGIGIPPSKLETIFNEFEQAENSTTRRFGGTGLGLAITKKLIELQNGEIFIESEESKGTTLKLSIPYTLGSEDQLVIEEKTPINSSVFKGKKILIVDDVPYNLLLLAIILNKWGIDCFQATNGLEALKMIKNNKYDLVLMDMIMPVMNGLEATRAIRKLPIDKKNIPVIALTAAATKNDINRIKHSGMNDFLLKPYKEQELFKKLIRIFNIDTSKTDLSSSRMGIKKAEGQRLNLQNSNISHYDLKELKNQANGDKEFVKEMIRLFIRSTSEGIKIMKEGSEKTSWETIQGQAHKIIAPCRHLETKSMVTLLKEIEKMAEKKQEMERIQKLVIQLEEEAKTVISLLRDELEKPA